MEKPTKIPMPPLAQELYDDYGHVLSIETTKKIDLEKINKLLDEISNENNSENN